MSAQFFHFTILHFSFYFTFSASVMDNTALIALPHANCVAISHRDNSLNQDIERIWKYWSTFDHFVTVLFNGAREVFKDNEMNK